MAKTETKPATKPAKADDLVAIKLKALGESDEYLKKITGKNAIRKGETVRVSKDRAIGYLESGRWELAKGKTKVSLPAPEGEGAEGDGAGNDAGNEGAQ